MLPKDYTADFILGFIYVNIFLLHITELPHHRLTQLEGVQSVYKTAVEKTIRERVLSYTAGSLPSDPRIAKSGVQYVHLNVQL